MEKHVSDISEGAKLFELSTSLNTLFTKHEAQHPLFPSEKLKCV